MKLHHTILALLLIPSLAIAETKELSVDLEKSTVGWVGSKVTGKHNGTVNLKSGTITVDGKEIKSGKFELDMTSIVNEDVESDEWRKKLEDHLKSDDFFSVTTFPTASFELTKAEAAGNEYSITGKLTI